MRKRNYHNVYLGKSRPGEAKEEIALEYPAVKCITKQHIVTCMVMA